MAESASRKTASWLCRTRDRAAFIRSSMMPTFPADGVPAGPTGCSTSLRSKPSWWPSVSPGSVCRTSGFIIFCITCNTEIHKLTGKLKWTGAAGHVLYVLRLRHHDNREALPDPVEDDGHHYVGHGDRPDRIVPVTDVLWRPRSPAQVDSLGHDSLRRELIHLFVTSLYLRRTADPSKRDAAQRRRARR